MKRGTGSFILLPILVGNIPPRIAVSRKVFRLYHDNSGLVLRFSVLALATAGRVSKGTALLTQEIWLILVLVMRDVIIKPLTSFCENVHDCTALML